MGQFGGDFVNYLEGDYVSVYVLIIFNFIFGFFLMMLVRDVVEFDMLVDEVFKYIILMGVVVLLLYLCVIINI